jgi:hypothetical protein
MAEEDSMAKSDDRIQNGILGDINPAPDPIHGRNSADTSDPTAVDPNPESMDGGSRHDRDRHSGSREVTESPSGGTGTEVGGTRNYRQGSGATGGDIGNRPE